MPNPQFDYERDKLRDVLEQIQAGQIVLKNGQQEVIDDIEARLQALDAPKAAFIQRPDSPQNPSAN
jgi:hypothetical protein